MQPVLLESRLGYNIVQFGTAFFALSESLGDVHVTDGAQVLIERHGDKNVIVAHTLNEVRARIVDAAGHNPAQPVLLESMFGYNIVQLGTEFFALRQGLGDVHVTDGAQALIERHGDKNVMVADTLEGIRARVEYVLQCGHRAASL